MNQAHGAVPLRAKFDQLFPVKTNLQTCLETVHFSYQLFQIHDGHTEKDGHLEEGLYAVHPVILHCVKDILATGPKQTVTQTHHVQ